MGHISDFKEKIHSPKQKVLDDSDDKDTLHKLHAYLVFVLAKKVSNNVTVVYKNYHVETLINGLGINTTSINAIPTYFPSTGSFDEILKRHSKSAASVGLEMSEEDDDKHLLDKGESNIQFVAPRQSDTWQS